ncbi:MAG: hypothetical protein DRH50_16105 [Deltaproteobacteria bacterium]|nr:MAG: hypothetical protein DRH50_16105 [Deltaproteobacteria bacterium]
MRAGTFIVGRGYPLSTIALALISSYVAKSVFSDAGVFEISVLLTLCCCIVLSVFPIVEVRRDFLVVYKFPLVRKRYRVVEIANVRDFSKDGMHHLSMEMLDGGNIDLLSTISSRKMEKLRIAIEDALSHYNDGTGADR